MIDIICRICLMEKNDSCGEWWSVFDKISKKTILQLMMDCANLKVLEDDPLPKIVCQKCFENVKFVSTLIDLMIASDAILREKYFKVHETLDDTYNNELSHITEVNSYKTDSPDSPELKNKLILNGYNKRDAVDLSCNVKSLSDADLKIEIKSEEACLEEVDCVKDNCSPNKNAQVHKKTRKRSRSPSLYEMSIKLKKIKQQITAKTKMKSAQNVAEMDPENINFIKEACDKQKSDYLKTDAFDDQNADFLSNNKDDLLDERTKTETKSRRSNMKKAKCPICNHVSVNKYVLRQHIRLKHEMDEAKKPYCCDKCPKRYINNYQLKVHLNSHTGAKPYPCDMCDRKFKSPTAARLHKQLQHIADKKWKCFHCQKGFISQHMLQNHVRQAHTKERPFLCEMCSKGFAAKGMLTTHIKSVHNRETEPCPVCKKEYNIFSMKVHLQSHQGVKNHVCETCGNAFTTKGSLKAHKFIHTGEKPNVCQICGKGFIQKQSLKKHIMSHSDLRPFLCSLCNETYKYRQDLIRHMKKHQKE